MFSHKLYVDCLDALLMTYKNRAKGETEGPRVRQRGGTL